jgi:hypothetical protein
VELAYKVLYKYYAPVPALSGVETQVSAEKKGIDTMTLKINTITLLVVLSESAFPIFISFFKKIKEKLFYFFFNNLPLFLLLLIFFA